MPEMAARPAQPPEDRSSPVVKMLPGHGCAQDPTKAMTWEKPILPSVALPALDGSLRCHHQWHGVALSPFKLTA